MNLTYHIFKDSMILNIGDKTVTISKTDKRYDVIYNLIKESELEFVGTLVQSGSDLQKYIEVKSRIEQAVSSEHD